VPAIHTVLFNTDMEAIAAYSGCYADMSIWSDGKMQIFWSWLRTSHFMTQCRKIIQHCAFDIQRTVHRDIRGLEL